MRSGGGIRGPRTKGAEKACKDADVQCDSVGYFRSLLLRDFIMLQSPGGYGGKYKIL